MAGIARTWTPINLQDDSDISSVSLSSSDSSPRARDAPPTSDQTEHDDAVDDAVQHSSSTTSSIADLTAVASLPQDDDPSYEDDFEEPPPALTDQLVEAMAATAQLHIDNTERMAALRERELRRQSSSSKQERAVHAVQPDSGKPAPPPPVLQQRTLNSMHGSLAAALPSMIASVSAYTRHHLLNEPCTTAPPRGRLAPHLLEQLATAMEQMQREAASLQLRHN